VVAQAEPDDSECVYYVYTVRTPRRDELAEYLSARGVETGLFYPKAIYEQPAYEGKWQAGDYPVTQRLQPEILSLPVFPGYSDDDIAYVADAVRQFFTAG
jgi:dTDP-4-amino-4,6-dideoxygalactose transaminase